MPNSQVKKKKNCKGWSLVDLQIGEIYLENKRRRRGTHPNAHFEPIPNFTSWG